MNNTGKIITAVAAGAAAGAILVFYLLPPRAAKPGQKINEQGKKLASTVKDKFEKGKERMNNLKEEFTKTVQEKIEEFA